MTAAEPRPLTRGDVPVAATAIARAFAWHEPWGAWALPDERSRERVLTGLVAEDLGSRFVDEGECWTLDRVSFTLWIPPGVPAFEARRGAGAYRVFGERGAAMRAGDELIASLKPRGEHWYLDTIATAPERMRAGLGGRLLDHNLALRDAAGHRTALDTHTPENVAFYRRRGFEVIGRDRLPAGGPELYVMVREAGGGSTGA